MRNKIAQLLLAATVVLALGAAMSQPAEAHRRGLGAGLAIGTILGLGIAGAYAAGPRYYDAPGCYRGPRQCGWTGRRCCTPSVASWA